MKILKIISKLLSKISTLWLLRDYFCHSLLNKKFRERRKVIEQFDENTLKQKWGCSDFEERSFPTLSDFKKDGWFRFMYQRYLMALRYTKEKTVLDSCCGLGWGSFLIAMNSKLVIGVDSDLPSIQFARDVWKSSNLNFIQKDIYDFFKTNKISFDVILAMETLEHFTKDDGIRYLQGIVASLNSNGIFIGSSSFAETREQAEMQCTENPNHLYIYTEKEIKELLNNYFENVKIYSRLFFLASKKKQKN